MKFGNLRCDARPIRKGITVKDILKIIAALFSLFCLSSEAFGQFEPKVGHQYVMCKVGVARPDNSSDIFYSIPSDSTGISFDSDQEIESLARKEFSASAPETTSEEIQCSHGDHPWTQYSYDGAIGSESVSHNVYNMPVRKHWVSFPNGWLNGSAALQGSIQSFLLSYQDGEPAGRGYRNASIKLRYRFLVCADEIQIVYGLDRKSLEHSAQYVIRSTGSGHFAYENPATEPPVPLAVPINLTIIRKTTSTIVGKLHDAAAGESLGMGCFTGQARKVTTLAAVFGPKPTKARIQQLLDSLTLRGQNVDGGAVFDFPLLNPSAPASSGAKPLTSVPRVR